MKNFFCILILLPLITYSQTEKINVKDGDIVEVGSLLGSVNENNNISKEKLKESKKIIERINKVIIIYV